MNIKSLITILLAILLAFLCAFFVFKKDKNVNFVEKTQQVIQEVMEEQTNAEDKLIKEEKEFSKTEEIKNEKSVVFKKNNEVVVEDFTEKPIVENIVQEASIVEEVSDYGIMKDEDGNIIITRAFSPKTKYKYSFRDFGVIDKVSSK